MTFQADDGQYELKGCGNPLCSGCNSHIPREVAKRMPSASRQQSDYVRISSEDIKREFQRAMGRTIFPTGGFAFIDPSGPSPAEPAGPPASYTAAREAVEEYLLETEQLVSWDDIVGAQEAKDALNEAIEDPVNNSDLYAYYGMKPPKGVLLYGPPGCGKTMFAKASAAALSRIYGKSVDVLAINGTELQSPYVGVTGQIIQSLFHYAREYKKYHGHPLLMFIDEAEVFLPDRNGRGRPVSSWEQSNVAMFLAELDGLEDLGAFVMLATNRPESIDEALLRDGRFNRKIRVPRPDRKATEAILYKVLKPIPTSTSLEALVMAGVESLFNPHHVIKEAHYIQGGLNKEGQPEIVRDIPVNFMLEHILSGAMVTGVAGRAKSIAFQRDKAAKTFSGLTTSDVIQAVTQIYEENRKLEHSYAVQEFVENFPVEEMRQAPLTKKGLQ